MVQFDGVCCSVVKCGEVGGSVVQCGLVWFSVIQCETVLPISPLHRMREGLRRSRDRLSSALSPVRGRAG